MMMMGGNNKDDNVHVGMTHSRDIQFNISGRDFWAIFG